MQKIVIIARNQAETDKAADLFTGYKIKKVYPGVKRFPRHFDCVVIYHNEANEVNFMKDVIQKFQDAPIKAFIGKEPYGDAKNYHAQAFKHQDLQNCIEYLKNSYLKLDEIMKKTFQSFDKDNSGYIDINELKEVSKELGRVMDQAELEECMQDLDMNKDNKITYDEFKKWWLSGRQGLSPWMRRLLAFKLKTLKFLDSISGPLKEIVGDASADTIEISTNHLSININKVEHAGTTLYVKVLGISPEVQNEFHRIKSMHKFKIDAHEVQGVMLNVTFDIKDISVDDAIKQLDEMFSSAPLDLKERLSYVIDGHRISVTVTPPVNFDEQIAPFKELMMKVQQELKVDQNIEATLRLAASPSSIFEEGGEALILQLLKGISMDLKLNVWKKIADVLMKLIESGDVDPSLMPIFGCLAPAFLLKLNGNLDIEIDDYMKEKITTNPMVEPLLMDANTLVSATSQVSSDEEFDEFLKNSVPHPLNKFAEFFIKHLGDEANFSFVHEHFGIVGRIHGQGLSLLLKTIMKYYS